MPSHRHAPADLRLWAEHEEADRAYAESRRARLDRLADESIAILNKWDTGEQGYLGTSWGKDSVLLMHMAKLAGIHVPIVWVRMRGRDNPDCESVRDRYSGIPGNYHERIFIYEDCSRDQHWKAVAQEFGQRRLTGLRMDESGRRAMSVRHLGIDTGASCRPLAHWTSPDVFAWAAIHDLPLHPAYAMFGGGRWPREQLRTHGIGGETGTNYGRREWEQEYYGDVLNHLKIAVPGRRK
ncbi:MAG TPA: hypothetical protein VGM05_22110 [Planctomycetaceae bacterium]|jgi:phosphoadenosine phosphosulfate reductase